MSEFDMDQERLCRKAGTTGVLGFIIDSQRHAAHFPYSCFPHYLGQNVVLFLHSLGPESYDTMAQRIREITWVDPQAKPGLELQERYKKAGFAEPFIGEMDQPLPWSRLLGRTRGWGVFSLIYRGALQHIPEIDLVKDGFPQRLYFVDFENEKLERLEGGQVLDVVSFEKLREEEGYMDKLEKMKMDKKIKEDDIMTCEMINTREVDGGELL